VERPPIHRLTHNAITMHCVVGMMNNDVRTGLKIKISLIAASLLTDSITTIAGVIVLYP
jgi:hypothetical protein